MLGSHNEMLEKSARNIPEVRLTLAGNLSVRDILAADTVLAHAGCHRAHRGGVLVTAARSFELIPAAGRQREVVRVDGRGTLRVPLPSNDATKIQIRHALEEAFVDQKITVIDVNTINVRGKKRRRSRGQTRVLGQSPDWKKAIVTLGAGQKIEGLFEGV